MCCHCPWRGTETVPFKWSYVFGEDAGTWLGSTVIFLHAVERAQIWGPSTRLPFHGPCLSVGKRSRAQDLGNSSQGLWQAHHTHTLTHLLSPLLLSSFLCLLCLHPPWDGGSLSPVPPASHRDLWVGLLAWLAAQRTFRSWIHRTSLQLRSVSLTYIQFNSCWWWNRDKKVPLALFCLCSSENQTAGKL